MMGSGVRVPASAPSAWLNHPGIGPRYRSGVVTTYVKVGWKAARVMAVVLPVLRDANRARREPGRADPAETVEALGFWIDRRRRLPIYRIAARREADQMIRTWQGRAILDLPRSSKTALTSGAAVGLGGRLVRYHATRWLARVSRVAVLWMAVLALLIYAIVR